MVSEDSIYAKTQTASYNNSSPVLTEAILENTSSGFRYIEKEVVSYLTEVLYLGNTTHLLRVNNIFSLGNSAKAEVYLSTENEMGKIEEIIVVYMLFEGNKIAHIFKEPSEEYYQFINQVSAILIDYETVSYWKNLRKEELASKDIQSGRALSSVLYYLPWNAGKRFLVYQDYNKHFDFQTPVGSQETIVRASRGGTIHNAVGSKGETYVRIQHSDGTYGFYVHLKANSYKGVEGKQVKAGDCIGISGATGSNISGPHTHFNVSASSSNTDYGSPFGSGWIAVQFVEGTITDGNNTPYSQNPTNACNTSSVPGTVTGVIASDGAISAYVRVAYNNVSNATRYEVWRSTTSNFANASKVFDDNGSAYHDATATYDVIYYYWIRACNTIGCGGFSNSDSGYRTLASVPDTVTGVTASDGTISTYVRVAYNDVSNATRYEVWRSTTSNLANASKIFDDNGSAHHDATAAYDVIYYYWIRACNATGCAGFSNSDAGFRTLTPIDPCASGNDILSCATEINSLPYQNIISTSSATQSIDDPILTACGVLPGKKSVWYKFVPSTNDSFFIDTSGSNYDTMLGVFSSTAGGLVEVDCSDDYNNTLQSGVQVDMASSTTYYIVVYEYDDGSNTQTGESLSIQLTNSPFVTSITKISNSPDADNNVSFLVKFSEPVTNVDVNDFSLATVGVTGESLVSGEYLNAK